MKGVAIIGAGGHARVVAAILRAKNKPILGFFDDSYSQDKVEIIQGAPLIGAVSSVLNYQDKVSAVYLAIGNNYVRQQVFYFLRQHDFLLPPLIHPSAKIDLDVKIGEGTVICLGACVGTEVVIGRGCIINTGASIDHETILGDFVHLAPKSVLAGRVKIGDTTFVGMNVSIADKLSIGKNVVIGAGSIILKNVDNNKKIVGVYH